VPPGTVEIEVQHDDLSDDNILDWGLDDPSGFRGWGGGNSEPAVVGLTAASRSYVAGPIAAGEWRVVVGKAKLVDTPASYALTVVLRDAGTLPRSPSAPPTSTLRRSRRRPALVRRRLPRPLARERRRQAPARRDRRVRPQPRPRLRRDQRPQHPLQLEFFADAQAAQTDLLFVPGMRVHHLRRPRQRDRRDRVGRPQDRPARRHDRRCRRRLFRPGRLALDQPPRPRPRRRVHRLRLEARDPAGSPPSRSPPVASTRPASSYRRRDRLLGRLVRRGPPPRRDRRQRRPPRRRRPRHLRQPRRRPHHDGLRRRAEHPALLAGIAPAAPWSSCRARRSHGRAPADIRRSATPSPPTRSLFSATVTGAPAGSSVRFVRNGACPAERVDQRRPLRRQIEAAAPAEGEDRWRAEVIVDGKPRTITSHLWLREDPHPPCRPLGPSQPPARLPRARARVHRPPAALVRPQRRQASRAAVRVTSRPARCRGCCWCYSLCRVGARAS
jgi:hypothetical protein